MPFYAVRICHDLGFSSPGQISGPLSLYEVVPSTAGIQVTFQSDYTYTVYFPINATLL